MAITDATGAVNTSYQEKDTVAFTAGTLDTISACVTEVEGKINRGTLSATSTPTSTQVQNWLIRAKEELAEAHGFTFTRRFASCSTVAGQYLYSLPPDYNGGRTVLRDTSNDTTIDIWQEHWYDAKYPDPSADSNGEPKIACIKGMELWLAPPPDGAYTLELDYERSGADNTTTDMSWLPELERWRCVDLACAEAFEYLDELQKASVYRTKFAQGLQKGTQANGRRKWKSMKYQAVSGLAMHRAKRR